MCLINVVCVGIVVVVRVQPLRECGRAYPGRCDGVDGLVSEPERPFRVTRIVKTKASRLESEKAMPWHRSACFERRIQSDWSVSTSTSTREATVSRSQVCNRVSALATMHTVKMHAAMRGLQFYSAATAQFSVLQNRITHLAATVSAGIGTL